LINDPQLLVLDEPTTGMDPIGTRQIKDLILDLKQRGKTILLCSHLLADVEDVTDRVAVMYGGKVREEGTISDLLVQQELTTIRTEVLPEAAIGEIEAVLSKYGKHIDRVDQPRQKLEELFLEIVHRAQSEGIATSGAGSGGRMAAFLTGSEAEPKAGAAEESATEDVLSKLVQPEPARPKQPAEPEQRDAPAPNPQAQSPREDREALDGLLEPKKPTPPPQPEMPEPKAPKRDDEVDRDVLDDLLGNDRK
jgi:ABC-2 type transport system ATP-binding protein